MQEYHTFMLMLTPVFTNLLFFTASRKTENELYKFVYISQNEMAQYMELVYARPYAAFLCCWVMVEEKKSIRAHWLE